MPSVPPDSEFAPDTALSPELVQDMARIFRQLGVLSFRSSVVESHSMSFQATWSISDSGQIGDSERPADSVFPGAASVVSALADAGPDETVAHKLSPRRWGFAWHFDGPHVVVAEAHFREPRDTLGAADTALVRLVCGIGIRTAQSEAPGTALSSLSMAWPKTERRARPKQVVWPQLFFTLCTVLLTAWLAMAALPRELEAGGDRRAELARLHAMADKTMVHGLSIALASGDYGDVQTALSSFHALGYFSSALVTNAKTRIVSLAGEPHGLRIGDPIPADAVRKAQALDLRMGSERLGQLLVTTVGPATEDGKQSGVLRLLATLAFVAATASAGLIVWRLARQRARPRK